MISEPITIIPVLRDRFSPTGQCIDEIIRHTPEPHSILVVIGGAPERVQKKLLQEYGQKAQFIFKDHLLNPSELRNIGLRAAKTRLAVLMDNDLFVRPGWLEPLVRCQRETGAAMVVPIILEQNHIIHTAGNDLFLTYKDGVTYGQKTLRYCRQILYKGTNLKRQPIDYGELHCQLVDVKIALDLNVYDEKLREVAEVDSGLVWAKAGHKMMFEPESVVNYDFPERVALVEDIAPFKFKWDMDAIHEGYQYFYTKWGIDITECGLWREFNAVLNNKLGFLSRVFPSRPTLAVDNLYYGLRKSLSGPGQAWRNFKNWTMGYYRWKATKKTL